LKNFSEKTRYSALKQVVNPTSLTCVYKGIDTLLESPKPKKTQGFRDTCEAWLEMAIRVFGRVLFSGFALPKIDLKSPNSRGKYAIKPLFAALRSRRVLKWLVPGLAFIVLLASTQTSNAAIVASDSNQCQVDVANTTGVFVSLSSGRCFLRFTSTGSNTWTAPTGVTTFNTLVIAGGGGGGADGGSGGGSGSMYEATVNLNGNTGRAFAITVGAGGGSKGC
jgi:hypothetical protein